MFNPSKYRMTETADYEVVDAKGDIIYLDEACEKPWTITVDSPATKRALKAKHDLTEAASGDLIGQMKGKKSKKDEESDIRMRADFLVKITRSTNAEGLEYNGKTGLDALREIYLDPFMNHVAAGLDKFHNESGNFTAPSATN